MSEARDIPIARLLRERSIRPRRRLGQNFMIDRNMLDFLVRCGGIEEGDVVLEVGTGVGFLTQRLAQRAGAVVSVEIDRGLWELADERLSVYPNVALVHSDALERGGWAEPVLEALASARGERTGALRLVSNLPYSIATAVVKTVLTREVRFDSCVFTCQWEVALRLVAEPGSRDYGYISVLAALLGETRILRKLPPSVFWPRPRVDSAVVGLVPRLGRFSDGDKLRRMLRGLSLLMNNRRKTLKKVIKPFDIDEDVKLGAERRQVSCLPRGDQRIFKLSPKTLADIALRIGD